MVITALRRSMSTQPPSVLLAAVASLAVATAAFARSFSALSHLALMHDWPPSQAWLLAICIDGMVVVPTVAVVVRRRARWWAWSMLVAGTMMSVAANATHAWLTTGSRIAVALAIIPPLVTLAATHLTLEIARQDRDTDHRDGGDETTPDRAPAADEHETPAATPTSEPAPVRRLRVAPTTETAGAPSGSDATPRATTPDAISTPRAATQATLDLGTVTPTVPSRPDAAPRRRVSRVDDTELRARALELVAAGGSRRAVAETLGVSKDRVQRWCATASSRETVAV